MVLWSVTTVILNFSLLMESTDEDLSKDENNLVIKKVFLKYPFIYLFFFKREHGWGRGRERGRHRIQNLEQALGSDTEPNMGLEPMDHEFMTWTKVGCLTDWATQAPQQFGHFRSIPRGNSGSSHISWYLLPSNLKSKEISLNVRETDVWETQRSSVFLKNIITFLF